MMGMSMSMGMTLTHRQECVICSQCLTEHASGCPEGVLKALVDKRTEKYPLQFCPACCRDGIDVNRNDFYECRNCRKQFSASEFVPEADASKLRGALIGSQHVVMLPREGKGDFPVDDMIKEWTVIRDRAKAQARRKRKKK